MAPARAEGGAAGVHVAIGDRDVGKVLGRPTVLPLPAPAARVMLGEVADALLLASQRMEPAKLEATGYDFRYPQLEGALRHLLGR